MASHSNLSDASEEGFKDVQAVLNNSNNLLTPFNNFLSDVAGILDPEREAERTVLNWVTVALSERKSVRTVVSGTQDGQSQDDANVISFVQSQLLRAAAEAADAGRISSTQASNILAAYNNRW